MFIKCDCGKGNLEDIAETRRTRSSTACGEPIDSTLFFSCQTCGAVYYMVRINTGNFLSGDEVNYKDVKRYRGLLTRDEIKSEIPKKFGFFVPGGYDEIDILEQKGRYFRVDEGERSLRAVLVGDQNGDRKILLMFIDGTNQQTAEYSDGFERNIQLEFLDGDKLVSPLKGVHIPGYLSAYEVLGPRLREQIPSDWHQVLGRWLAPKK